VPDTSTAAACESCATDIAPAYEQQSSAVHGGSQFQPINGHRRRSHTEYSSSSQHQDPPAGQGRSKKRQKSQQAESESEQSPSLSVETLITSSGSPHPEIRPSIDQTLDGVPLSGHRGGSLEVGSETPTGRQEAVQAAGTSAGPESFVCGDGRNVFIPSQNGRQAEEDTESEDNHGQGCLAFSHVAPNAQRLGGEEAFHGADVDFTIRPIMPPLNLLLAVGQEHRPAAMSTPLDVLSDTALTYAFRGDPGIMLAPLEKLDMVQSEGFIDGIAPGFNDQVPHWQDEAGDWDDFDLEERGLF